MRKDVWVCFFGVAYPAGAGGCKDWLFGGSGDFVVGGAGGEDFVGAEDEAGLTHSVCVDYPGKGIAIFPA